MWFPIICSQVQIASLVFSWNRKLYCFLFFCRTLRGSLAENPEMVMDFLGSLTTELNPRAARDYNTMRDLKKMTNYTSKVINLKYNFNFVFLNELKILIDKGTVCLGHTLFYWDCPPSSDGSE